MKKILSTILALLVLIGCAASAEVDVISGNASTGGAAAMDANGALWFSMGGLKRLNPDNSVDLVAEGSVRGIQYAGGYIYYVSRAETGAPDEYADTLWRVGANGAPEQIGGARRAAWLSEYADETFHLSRGTTYLGYQDLAVYGGYIYFLGTDDEPGSYETRAIGWDSEGETSYTTEYEGAAAVYRMDMDGGNLVKLISGLGNGYAHMAIAGGRIAVASCFRNPVYAYDFTNFMFYSMDGSHIETIANTSGERHSWVFKEEEEFTVIVNSIQTDGERIYASLSDSEGDFASSRLVDVANSEETIAIEAFYATSIVAPDALYYVTADVEDTFWEEDMEYTTVLCRRAADGAETILAHIPHTYVGYNMQLALQGNFLYLSTRDLMRGYTSASGEVDREAGQLLRVNLETGAVDELTGLGFSVSMACDPEFYTPPVLAWQNEESAAGEDYIDGAFLLPDSDVYIFTPEELEVFDKEALALMRNEILARHGYIFQNESYREYFASQGWYEENPDFSYDDLNAVEMENIETIKALEAEE